MEPGWVMTVEPGIYIPKENFAVRLENTVLVTRNGPVDLMPNIPIEAEEIEQRMHASGNGKNGNGKTAKARTPAQVSR
jgi:Xaa-Pro aminopeptidase